MGGGSIKFGQLRGGKTDQIQEPFSAEEQEARGASLVH
jgi:hypothetical protein